MTETVSFVMLLHFIFTLSNLALRVDIHRLIPHMSPLHRNVSVVGISHFHALYRNWVLTWKALTPYELLNTCILGWDIYLGKRLSWLTGIKQVYIFTHTHVYIYI